MDQLYSLELSESSFLLFKNDFEALSESIAYGRYGDPVNLVNLIVAIGQSVNDYKHKFIQNACKQLLISPKSFAADDFWDILLRLDTAGYAGLEFLPDPKLKFSEYLKKQNIQLDDEDRLNKRIPIGVLVSLYKNVVKGYYISRGLDPRMSAFYLHYLYMINERCKVPISENTFNEVINTVAYSTRQTIHDSNQLDPYTIVKRLSISFHSLVLVQNWEFVYEFAHYIFHVIKQFKPSLDQTAFLLWDLSSLIGSPINEPQFNKELSSCIDQLFHHLIALRTEEDKENVFSDIRNISIYTIGISAFLSNNQRSILHSLLDSFSFNSILVQLRLEILQNLSSLNRRNIIDALIKQLPNNNEANFISNLHLYLHDNIVLTDNLYDNIIDPVQVITEKCGDNKSVTSIIASILTLKNIPAYLTYLDPEFSRPGHFFAEIIQNTGTEINNKNIELLTPIDPLCKNIGEYAPMVHMKDQFLIRMLLSDFLNWTPDEMNEFINHSKSIIKIENKLDNNKNGVN